ncbi:FAD binding domain-containing protein [Talaromyces proteolyticus]|uniref:FAD binding domain-containing protein n=1 Tax=Talaromyces proteolyticus TaxID=1131652 RepID=A0AAD4KZI8_9EURO|nr:FAD binding domain-containing protein [Talaromyces proteolyticus]KAH8703493.1 FAD binding domain-containing protein [Talaromyces proteolyticus]
MNLTTLSKMAIKREKTSVLIIGGSLVGLSTAVFLSHQGIKPILIERHADSSPHPRAMGFLSRSMEAYRSSGLKDKIPLADPNFKLVRTRVHSLAGDWHENSYWNPEKSGAAPKKGESEIMNYSYTIGADAAQDEMEGYFREAALSKGADLRYSTTLISFQQDQNGITALLKNRVDGTEYEIRADYMVAADGNRSFVRESLGIERDGRGHMQTMRSVLFKAPGLDKYRKDAVQFSIDQPDLQAFLVYYRNSRWALMFSDEVERDETAYKDAIYKAIGDADITIEIITTGEWELTALIANSYQSGRIFLAGDSAHTLPPNRGGFGANTGIADAWNLSWKLASVVKGHSRPELLDTYEVERRPVALFRHDQMFLRQDYKTFAAKDGKSAVAYDDIAIELGELYRSKAVISDSSNEEIPVKRPDEWNGEPGTRAAHWWLSGDKSRSTIDFYGENWVLITESEEWKDAVAQVNDGSKSLKIDCIQLGVDEKVEDLEGLRKIMGITDTGASLIRPDGIVAWRSQRLSSLNLTPAEELNQVLSQVAFLTDLS